jgi:hypothetical protein
MSHSVKGIRNSPGIAEDVEDLNPSRDCLEVGLKSQTYTIYVT